VPNLPRFRRAPSPSRKPDDPSNLPGIRFHEVYSDDQGTGQLVGGRTIAPSCTAFVPLSPAMPMVLGMLMAGLGVAMLTRKRALPQLG
jgi:hypothetical protein